MRRLIAVTSAIFAGALIAAVPAGAAKKQQKIDRPHGAVAAVPKGHCVPIPGFYMADRVIRTRSASRSAVTELFADGSYRVTRCDAKGRLLRTQHVARMKVKHGGVQRVILSSGELDGKHIRLGIPTYAAPDNAKEAAAFEKETRGRLMSRTKGDVVRVGRAKKQGSTLRAAQVGGECSDGSWAQFTNPRISGVENYHINIATMPSDGGDLVKQQEFAMRIVNGHDVWNFRIGCKENRLDRWQSVYAGETGTIGGYWAGLPPDGMNVIDGWFGPFCGSDSVLACVGPYVDPVTFSLIETDTRYNLNYDLSHEWWSGGQLVGADLPPGNRFDAFAVASHESGHEMGCGHVGVYGLTMYPFIARGEHHQRDLGLGDMNCMDALYDP